MALLPALAAAALAVPPAPVPVTAALLDGLAPHMAEFTAHGTAHRCQGPLLREVVARISPAEGQAARGAALSTVVLVTGRDGYRVVFGLGELDPGLGASRAIIATHCDGKPVGNEDGPFRLVVPGEERAARSARQVATIALVDLPQASE